MNKYTRDIAALLDITLEQAKKVQFQMMVDGVNFSRCSTASFNKKAKLAAKEISV
jgi:hypothetical protein